MAGVVGFEPTNVGVRVQCLTTWRRPITNLLYIFNKAKSSVFNLLNFPNILYSYPLK